jgi:ATP synthase protein I
VTSIPTDTSPTQQDQAASEVKNSMQEYYQLQETLLKYTLFLLGGIFVAVWLWYSLNMALNYALGATVGIVYLAILFKDVEKIGQRKGRGGSRGLLLFAGLIIIACRWQQLHIIPVFLGFLTYKVAIIVYMFQSLMLEKQRT